jgi:Tfp pilus assembly protein PilO
MIPTETGDRRANLKNLLLERLHDPLQLRILVIGVLLLVGYMGVYTPLSEQIAATTQKIRKEQKLAELAGDLEQLQTQCNSFAKRLPQQADSKEWMQYMHEGVRGFPLKLSKLESLALQQIGPCQVVALRIELEGSYFDLDQFLRWLELNPRLLRADEMSITLAKSRENRDDMIMQLTVLGMAG